MTSSDQPARGPVGMPAHLWELACSDVRLSVPTRVRNAVANGLNAPEGVRRIAARVAVTGAALGVPAAIIGLGGFLDTADTPVDLAGGEAPLDGVDGAPAMPGSYDGGSGPGGGHGGHSGGGADGFAHQTTTGEGDVSSGLGSTWHVQDPSVPGGDWLTVQMFQDVTVTETADGMFVVDAWQFIVVHDSHGQEYTFKEHYQVIVPDPPGQETDLVVHEHGFVHVTERPDGTFAVDPHFGIDVLVTDDGDGHDEVTIGQTQHVRYTDTDGRTDDDVTVDLSEKATSTSDDTGDEATTTIHQGQVFDDGDEPAEPWSGGTKQTTVPETTDRDPQTTVREGGHDRDPYPDTHPESGAGGVDPSSPFGEEPADRGATGSPSGAGTSSTGQPTQPAASGTSSSTASTASSARPLDPAPLSSTVVAAPAASVLAGEGPLASGPELDEPPSAVAAHDPSPGAGRDGHGVDPQPQEQAHDPAGHPTGSPDGTPGPFGATTPPAGQEPFEPPPSGTTTPETTDPSTSGTGTSTSDDRTEPGDNTPGAGHESLEDPSSHAGVPQEPVGAEHGAHDDTGHDTADHGTDGADHALAH